MARQSDRKTYDEATRLQFGLISKRNPDIADYAINNQAQSLAILRQVGTSYLTADNQTWLEDFLTDLGRAQFITRLDPLSQASMMIASKKAPDKTQRTVKTPLDELKLDEEETEK